MCLKTSGNRYQYRKFRFRQYDLEEYAPTVETRELKIILVRNSSLMEGLVMRVLKFGL